MIRFLFRLFWNVILGFHWHTWTKWKKSKVYDQHGYGETVQVRECSKCGFFQSVDVYDD